MRVQETLRKLISFRTENPPGRERELAEWIAAFCRGLGMEACVYPVAEGRSNVRAFLRGRTARKALWFCGHLDVVPAGEGWKGDPFSLREERGRLYGRGACDMKGGIACMLEAAREMRSKGEEPSEDVVFWFVADEECDGLGTKAALCQEGGAKLCVIGEPTDLAVCNAHRGVYRPEIRLIGKSCHAGRPWEGINALEAAAKVIGALGTLRGDSETAGMRETITATVLRAGEKENVVPGHSELVLDWRTLPGQTREALAQRLNSWLSVLFSGQGVSWEIATHVYMAAARQEPFAGMGEGRVFGACSDMPLFLDAGIPTVLCGPGSLAQAHNAEEYVEASQLEAGKELYLRLMRGGNFLKV